MMFKISALVALVFILTSCATSQFREQNSICRAIWMDKIPPHYVQETYNQRRSREVPTGEITCTTSGYGYSSRTTCKQETRLEFYHVPAVRTVDRNKNRRNAEILACTQQRCNIRYGNVECKP